MSQNDITDDDIISKAASDEYRANYERIFRQQATEHTSSEGEHTSSEGEHASLTLPTWRLLNGCLNT